MSTRISSSLVARLAIAAACVISSASCGGELLRSSRSPIYLIVVSMEAAPGGGGATGAFLNSDVVTVVNTQVNGITVPVDTIFADSVTATLRSFEKNQDATASTTNAITVNRYRVDFRRSDGRNTPGVDVPFGFDGAVMATFNPGNLADVSFVLVRHQAKLEPPLRNLRRGGGVGFISAIAEVTFYGYDQNGNELSVTGKMDVHFGDFADQ